MVRVPPGLVNVAIAHGEPLLAMGLRAALTKAPRVRLVGDGEGNAEHPVHVLVSDWARGMRWLSADRADPGQAQSVLVISSQAREQPMLAALRRGLGGVLLSACTESELLRAVDSLAAGRSYVCAEVAQRVAANFSLEPLTCREETVLQLLARGQCNKSIATNLGIAPGTVKSHVKAILGKLAASTRTEAASIAAELGIVEFTRSPRFEVASLN